MSGPKSSCSILILLCTRALAMSVLRVSLAFVLLLAVLSICPHSTEASNWISKSSELSTPSWRRLEDPLAISRESSEHHRAVTREIELRRRELLGDDQFGPARFETSLPLYVASDLPSHALKRVANLNVHVSYR